jgi:putative AdoMet-dependent methyltransferase
MLNSKGFDLWANGNDKSVNLSEENNEYPFAGYKDVLNYIYNQVRENSYSSVLDIGFGTGILTTQLYNEGYHITGIDFSSSMIDIAKKKMPDATLINWDFTRGLPVEIKGNKYDYIISTYAIHHLSDEEKIEFIKSLSKLLNANGKILLGDVSFETSEELAECKETYKEIWDNEEFYFTANIMMKSLNEKYYCNYDKISYCSGVLTVANRISGK